MSFGDLSTISKTFMEDKSVCSNTQKKCVPHMQEEENQFRNVRSEMLHTRSLQLLREMNVYKDDPKMGYVD